MKKIVSIVAVAAMVSAMFAGEPAVNVAVTEFNGNASVTWGIDLDRGTTGFKNAASGSLKVKFVDGGDKATESDKAVWGEIKVKTDGMKAENGALSSAGATVDYAKLHIGPAWVGITAGDTQVGDFAPALATRWGSITTGKSNAAGIITDYDTDGNPVYSLASQGISVGYKMDKMFSAEVNFRSNPVEAEWPNKLVKDYKNWDGKENGQEVVYSDRYAISFKATMDMVENLGVAFGVEKDISCNKKYNESNADDYAIFGKVDYKIGLNDKFYVKPGVGVLWSETEDAGTWTSGIRTAAAVLLGWGAEKQDSNLKYLSAKDKVSNGFSVATVFDLGKSFTKNGDKSYAEGFGIDPETSKIVFGLYDTTFVEGLTFGADLSLANVYSKAYKDKFVVDGKEMNMRAKDGPKEGSFDKDAYLKTVDNTVYIDEATVAAKYAIKLDDKTITPQVAVVLGSKDITDKTEDKYKNEKDSTYKLVAEKFYVGVNFAGFVPYTTFDVDYETKAATNKEYMYKGYLNFTCKISL